MKKNYNSIDLCKFIFSIIVVGIHTNIMKNSNVWITISNLAVPFYFLATGFLSFQTDFNEFYDSDKMKKKLLKFIKIYTVWTLIYMPITVYGNVVIYKFSFIESLIYTIRGVFIIGENFDSWPLWYLLSNIYTFYIIYIFTKLKINKKTINNILILFLILGCVITVFLNMKYNNFINTILKILFGTNGRLLIGFGYIAIGIKLAECKKTNYIIYIIGIIFSGISFLISSPLKRIFIVPVAIAIFDIVSKINIDFDEYLFKNLRKISTVTYFTHMIFFFLYTLLIGDVNKSGFGSFFVSLICTWILGIIIIKKKDNKIFKLLF